jgi:hypothetical protein
LFLTASSRVSVAYSLNSSTDAEGARRGAAAPLFKKKKLHWNSTDAEALVEMKLRLFKCKKKIKIAALMLRGACRGGAAAALKKRLLKKNMKIKGIKKNDGEGACRGGAAAV